MDQLIGPYTEYNTPIHTPPPPMYAANNEGINILGPVFARLSGNDESGNRLETAEMIYVSDTTDLFYLSRHAMEQLKIIAPNFPRVGAAASLSETITKPNPNHPEMFRQNYHSKRNVRTVTNLCQNLYFGRVNS